MVSRIQGVVAVLTHRWFAAAVVLATCLTGSYFYVSTVAKLQPLDGWFVWSLVQLWWWMLVLSASCLSLGHLILERWLQLELPPLEALVQSMAVGLVGFVMAMYVGGALRLYGPVFAVLLPVACLAVGGRSLLRLLRRFWVELREPRPASPFVWLVAGLGAFCVGLAYLGVLSPDTLNYDSTWSHLVIAQDYARNGRIIKFWGNYNMGVPHLASIVHTWGWTVPGLGKPALRWMMALHNEFGLFCWTLVGVAAGVRRLVGDPVRGSWAGFFLFPIIFVYDNNMGGAADHIAAFFAPPLLLATLVAWERMTPAAAALLAVSCAGALLTKYQGAYLFVPLALVLGVRWLLLAYRLRRGRLRPEDPQVTWRQLWRAPLVLAGLGALLVAPHFLKNAVFYRNPLYPFAQDIFSSSNPSSPNAGPLLRYLFTDDNWRPKGGVLDKVLHSLQLFVTFSFKPHYSFTKDVPAFGSLFTLLLPALVVLRGAGAIWIATALASGALFLWGYTYNIDRNLQIFLPLMVCVAVALIVRVWRLGWVARAGLVPLLAVQLAWGSDALFYSAQDRLQSAFNLIRASYDGRGKQRLDGYRSHFLAVSDALPKNARVLLHSSHVTLGIDREVVMDWDAFQGFISYDELRTVAETYDYLRERGITHILLEPRSRAAPTKQEDILFNGLISENARILGHFGSFRLYEFPSRRPPAEEPYEVVTIGLHGYADGLYPITKLNTHEYLPAYVQRFAAPSEPLPQSGDALAAMLERCDAVVVATRSRLDSSAEQVLKRRFTMLVRYEGYFSVYLSGKGRRPL